VTFFRFHSLTHLGRAQKQAAGSITSQKKKKRRGKLGKIRLAGQAVDVGWKHK